MIGTLSLRERENEETICLTFELAFLNSIVKRLTVVHHYSILCKLFPINDPILGDDAIQFNWHFFFSLSLFFVFLSIGYFPISKSQCVYASNIHSFRHFGSNIAIKCKINVAYRKEQSISSKKEKKKQDEKAKYSIGYVIQIEWLQSSSILIEMSKSSLIPLNDWSIFQFLYIHNLRQFSHVILSLVPITFNYAKCCNAFKSIFPRNKLLL